jgi:hypothetical protein
LSELVVSGGATPPAEDAIVVAHVLKLSQISTTLCPAKAPNHEPPQRRQPAKHPRTGQPIIGKTRQQQEFARAAQLIPRSESIITLRRLTLEDVALRLRISWRCSCG